MIKLDNIQAPPQTAQTGIHEKYILCQKCEAKFSKYERYASHVLYESYSKTELIFENRVSKEGLQSVFVSGIDYYKLKLCFLSILWRAHISGHNFFKKVDISHCESEIHQILFTESNIPEEEYKLSIIGIRDRENSLLRSIVAPTVIPIAKGEVAFFFINGFFYIIDLKPASGLRLLDKSFLNQLGQIEIPILQDKIAFDFMKAFGLPEEILSLFIGKTGN